MSEEFENLHTISDSEMHIACIALSFRVFDTLVLALIDTGEKDADLCNLECIIDLIYNLQRFARNLRVMD